MHILEILQPKDKELCTTIKKQTTKILTILNHLELPYKRIIMRILKISQSIFVDLYQY